MLYKTIAITIDKNLSIENDPLNWFDDHFGVMSNVVRARVVLDLVIGSASS